MSTSTAAELAYLSRALKAPRVREVATRLAERARDEGWDHETYLAAVLAEEVSARDSHGGEARVKAARFPAVKTIDDFDFKVQPSVKREVIAHLAQLDFLAEAQNVVFLGPPGTGKTHCETDDPAQGRATAQTGAGSGGHTRKSHWPLGEPGGQDPNESLAARGLRACS